MQGRTTLGFGGGLTSPLVVVPSQGELQVLQNALLPTQSHLQCGTGLVAASANVSAFLARQRPQCVLLAGIAGSYDLEKVPMGRVVRIDTMSLADFGAFTPEGTLLTAESLGFGIQQYPSSSIELAPPQWKLALQKLQVVQSASVQVATGSDALGLQRSQSFQVDLEEMEGASLAALCIAHQIPFFHVRAISNKAGKREREHWKIPEALHQLSQWFQSIHE